MPISECDHCKGEFQWKWEDAFDKFGFMDGDGQVMTYIVRDCLEDHGYTVETTEWGLHNTVITSIQRDGIDQIYDSVTIGYDEPRDYLPEEIIKILDEELPERGRA